MSVLAIGPFGQSIFCVSDGKKERIEVKSSDQACIVLSQIPSNLQNVSLQIGGEEIIVSNPIIVGLIKTEIHNRFPELQTPKIY